MKHQKQNIIPFFLFLFALLSCGGGGNTNRANTPTNASSSESREVELLLTRIESASADIQLFEEKLPVTRVSSTDVSTRTFTNAPFSGNEYGLNWTIFRGDPSLSGHTAISLPDNPVLLWTFAADSRTRSSPIVYNGVTYWSDRRGRILGVDINGELVFDLDLEVALRELPDIRPRISGGTDATPMIYNSVMYLGLLDGYMLAISLDTKEILWRFYTDGQISASANIVEFEGQTALIFGSYDHYFYVLNAETGEELNRFDSGDQINGSAAVWNGHILFGGCDSRIRIIDTQTGMITDMMDLMSQMPNSPAIIGNVAYVGDHSGNMYRIHLANGRFARYEVIEHQERDADGFIAAPAVTSDAVFYYSGRHLYAVNRVDGSLRWAQLLRGRIGESSPVVAGDRVIACTQSGVVSIFDANTGELLWEYDTGEQIQGSPAVVAGHFMILTVRGTLLVFGNE